MHNITLPWNITSIPLISLFWCICVLSPIIALHYYCAPILLRSQSSYSCASFKAMFPLLLRSLYCCGPFTNAQRAPNFCAPVAAALPLLFRSTYILLRYCASLTDALPFQACSPCYWAPTVIALQLLLLSLLCMYFEAAIKYQCAPLISPTLKYMIWVPELSNFLSVTNFYYFVGSGTSFQSMLNGLV